MVDMPFSHKGFPHGKTILPAHASLYTPSESYPLTSVGMHYCLGIGSEIIIRRPSIRNIPNHIYAWHANTYHDALSEGTLLRLRSSDVHDLLGFLMVPKLR